MRTSLRLFRSPWYALGIGVAFAGWGFYVAALALAPISLGEEGEAEGGERNVNPLPPRHLVGEEPVVMLDALSDAGSLSFAAGAFVFAGLYAALALVIVRSGVLPGWLGGLAGLTAAAIALWVGGLFTTSGAFTTVDGLFGYWIGLIAFLAWTAIASVVLMGTVARGEGGAAPAPGPGAAGTQGPGPRSTP